MIRLIICTLLLTTTIGHANKFSIDEKKEIEGIIRDYLLSHPEILEEAVTIIQDRQFAQEKEKAIKIVIKQAPQIFVSKSPVLGNHDGSILIVEFLDYNCPHCRNMHTTINQLIKDNPDLKVIIKEFPVLGEDSVFAAKAALAADRQGKFAEMHHALMSEKTLLKNSRVLEIARDVGLNMATLQKDMEASDIELQGVKAIASDMNIKATPALIISQYPIEDNRKVIYIPGAVDKSILQNAINYQK